MVNHLLKFWNIVVLHFRIDFLSDLNLTEFSLFSTNSLVCKTQFSYGFQILKNNISKI